MVHAECTINFKKCDAILCQLHNYYNSVVPKVCSTDPKGSTTSSKRIRGYISIMASLKFTYFLNKGIMFC